MTPAKPIDRNIKLPLAGRTEHFGDLSNPVIFERGCSKDCELVDISQSRNARRGVSKQIPGEFHSLGPLDALWVCGTKKALLGKRQPGQAKNRDQLRPVSGRTEIARVLVPEPFLDQRERATRPWVEYSP